jgi:putative copper resistance protein D
MAQLLQIYGFLSVLLRAATLVFQSFTVGGIVFLVVVLGRREAPSSGFELSALRWIRRSAIALAATHLTILVASSLILMQSADMTLREVSGANFFLASVVGAAASLTIAGLASARRSSGYASLLLPAAALLVASVMTSHAMSRLEYRLPLVALTGLHQAATAVWLGGLPYLLIGLAHTPDQAFARRLSSRFSRLALVSVGILAAAGLLLSISYVGSIRALYGTSYGAMVATKAVLFGLLLFLGALNYQLIRGNSSSLLQSVRRFGEAEIGIGVTVILLAASLTSLPPAVDLAAGRVSGPEVLARMAPRVPRLSSPTRQDLPEDVYAALQKSYESPATLSSESYVPGQAGTRPNTPAEKAWSEYNHHWAGMIVLVIGLLAIFAQFGHFPLARNWPLVFLGLSVFLFLRSDPETWPLGPVGFWVSMTDPEVLLHRIVALLVIGLAVFEWRVQTDRVESPKVRLVFPVLIAIAGALLLTHSHSLGNIKEEVLAELSHAPLAVLGVTAAWSRWLELRLPSENRVRFAMAAVWPVCFLLIGALLLNYREM